MDITVWAVLNGDKYCDNDVYLLSDQVAANLSQPYKFRCLSDREIPGVDCLIPEENWPGWWAKLLLFRYATGSNLYFDLDVVITGNLSPLLSRGPLTMPANWAQSGHGGAQSSVMSWAWNYGDIPSQFDASKIEPPKEPHSCGRYMGLWGDQEYITYLLGNPGAGRIEEMSGIYSYKYHCRDGLPEDAAVVAFHGNPKPDQVNDAWVRESRYMLTRP